jgi:hypothetical protein
MARCQWFMPAIPTTWEAEIRRILAQDQHRENESKTLSQKYSTQKKGLVEWLKWLEHLNSKYEVLSSNTSTTK